jgi:hypothetical protein
MAALSLRVEVWGLSPRYSVKHAKTYQHFAQIDHVKGVTFVPAFIEEYILFCQSVENFVVMRFCLF